MTEVHVVPGVSHDFLILTGVFCDTGCQVMFDELECRIYYKTKWCSQEVWIQHRNVEVVNQLNPKEQHNSQSEFANPRTKEGRTQNK